MQNQIKHHFEFYVEDEDRAMLTYCMLKLLHKLNVGISSVSHAHSWGGDITLIVEYKDQLHPVTSY
jgi:hypothetical protein